MNYNLSWILFLMIQFAFVILHPVRNQQGADIDNERKKSPVGDFTPKQEGASHPQNEQVISVRITSSVAVGRMKDKTQRNSKNHNESRSRTTHETYFTPTTEALDVSIFSTNKMTDRPQDLAGANIEFIKQLNAKKEAKEHNLDQLHPFELFIKNQHYTTDDESLEESTSVLDEGDDLDNEQDVLLARKVPSSVYVNRVREKFETSQPIAAHESQSLDYDKEKEIHSSSNSNTTVLRNEKINLEITNISKEVPRNDTHLSDIKQSNEMNYEPDIGNSDQNKNSNETNDSAAESSIKSVIEVTTKFIDDEDTTQTMHGAMSQHNYLQEIRSRPLNVRDNTPRLTTVSFNIVHDDVKSPTNYNEQTTFTNPPQSLVEPVLHYEGPKIYSEPARIYSEPAKFYSEPAKIYSEPAKVYSEPAKVYSEPAKVYSEPAKFYSEPASLHLGPNTFPNLTPWQQYSQSPGAGTTVNTTPVTMITNPSVSGNAQKVVEHEPEKNYEVDEKDSVMTNGRSHGVQESSTEKCKQDNCKVGYVVEGRQYKKYRVEERTSDGFIVGEYGVVRNEDGALRGVRYTADSDASPRLIYDALMKFLQLR